MSLSGWNPNNTIDIIIPNQGEDLVYFPILINLSDSSGIRSFDCSVVFDELTDINNKKIAIEYIPTGEQCYIEIEFWDSISKKAVLHTKVPKIIAGAETKLRLYYDANHSDNTDINTKFLLQADKNTIEDGCLNKLITNNNISISTTQFIIGNQSFSLSNSSSSYLDFSHGDDLKLGANDFTIDWWEYRTAYNEGDVIIKSAPAATTGYIGFLLSNSISNNSNIYLSSNGSSWDIANAVSFGTVTLNTWEHKALVRSGSTFYLFKNGNLVTTFTSTASILDPTGISVGRHSTSLDGYIDRIRITNGKALWTSNFTPPNSYHDILYVGDTGYPQARHVWTSNYVAVYHMAQDPSTGGACILDSTINANHGTPYGTMTYDDLVDGLVGKALNFDGVDDYIDIGDVFDPVNFTVEAVYTTTITGPDDYYTLIADKYPNYVECALYFNASNNFRLETGYFTGVWHTASLDLVPSNDGMWHTASSTYDGAYLTPFLDGTGSSTSSTTAITTQSNSYRIGARWDSELYGGWWSGRIAEIRISDIARSEAWITATNKSLKDELLILPRDTQPLPGWNPNNIITITIPDQGEDLVDFPVLINLSDSSGINSFDLTRIFNEFSAIYPNNIYDDFTGNDGYPPNEVLWTTYNSTASIQNNKCRNTGIDVVESKFTLDGDFDIQIQWDKTPGTWDTGDSLYFKVESKTNSFIIYREYNNERITGTDGTNYYYSAYNWDTGYFRIELTGTDLTLWFKQYENDTWINMHTFTGTDTKGYVVQFYCINNAVIDFDNFKVNSGTIIWPNATKKIAIEYLPTGKQCYTEVEFWDNINKKAVLHTKVPKIIAGTETKLRLYYDKDHEDNVYYISKTNDTKLVIATGGSKTNAIKIHDLGELDNGSSDLTVYGTPVDNGTYYTFNGVDQGLYRDTDLGDSSNEVCFARIIIRNKNKGQVQTIWKDGGYLNGIAAGIDNNGNLGLFGRNNGTLTSITIPPTDYENNIWYNIYFSKTRVLVLTLDNKVVAVADGSISSTDGSEPESVGMTINQSPISGSSSTNIEFFDGDIDTIEIYSEADMVLPTTLTAAQNVWYSNYVAVYHMSQDPSGTAPQIIDSTAGKNNGTANGGMTSSDLVDGLTGKALDFDGNDYISVTQNSSFDLQTLQIEALYNPRGFGGGAGLPTILGRWGSTNSFFFSIDDGDLYPTGTIRLNTTNQSIYSNTTLSTGQYYHLVGSYGGGSYKIHIDGAIEKTVNQTDTVATGSSELLVGALNNSNISNNLNGVLQELRVSDIIRSDKWVSATNKSLRDDLLSFSVITFYYTNIYPNNTTVHGLQQQLQSTITISGTDSNYIYDAAFYLTPSSIINTISGSNSGDTVHVSLDTLVGGTYNWYIETTTSGVTDISPTYSFEVRYLCSGICSGGSNTLSGIKIMLHKRDTGELVGYDLSDAEGRFSIETIHNTDHYAVALHNSNNYNALVYDRLRP